MYASAIPMAQRPVRAFDQLLGLHVQDVGPEAQARARVRKPSDRGFVAPPGVVEGGAHDRAGELRRGRKGPADEERKRGGDGTRHGP